MIDAKMAEFDSGEKLLYVLDSGSIKIFGE